MAIELASSPPLFCTSPSSFASSPSPSSSSSSIAPKFAFPLALSSPASPPPRPPAFLPSSIALSLLASTSSYASAVSYDDLSLPPPPPPPAPLALDFDFGAIADSLTDFVFSNPIVVFAGVAAVGVPILVSSLFAQPKSWGFASARDALKKLSDEEVDAQLLDIRSGDAVKTEGTPDLRELRKRPLQLTYSGEDEAYLKKLLSKFKNPENTTLYVLDEYDGNSVALAELLAAKGFNSAYAIKDGAEGPNGWRKNELPWLLPRKGFPLDIGAIRSVVEDTFGENPNLVPATLGVAAAAGVSLVVFSEAETALQLLGSAALIQLFVKKFLFAEDRKKTVKELQTFLDTRIAPKELVDELKGIGQVLLPKFKEVPIVDSTNGAVASETGQAASAEEVEGKQTEVLASSSVDLPKSPTPSGQAASVEQGEEKQTEVLSSSSVDLPKSPTPSGQAASVEQVEGKQTEVLASSSVDLPKSPTPLSPYAQFPDLKPPSSPTPSRP